MYPCQGYKYLNPAQLKPYIAIIANRLEGPIPAGKVHRVQILETGVLYLQSSRLKSLTPLSTAAKSVFEERANN